MLDFTELNDNENESTGDVPTRIAGVTSIFMYICMLAITVVICIIDTNITFTPCLVNSSD